MSPTIHVLSLSLHCVMGIIWRLLQNSSRYSSVWWLALTSDLLLVNLFAWHPRSGSQAVMGFYIPSLSLFGRQGAEMNTHPSRSHGDLNLGSARRGFIFPTVQRIVWSENEWARGLSSVSLESLCCGLVSKKSPMTGLQPPIFDMVLKKTTPLSVKYTWLLHTCSERSGPFLIAFFFVLEEE